MSVQDRIMNRVRGRGRGVVFKPKDFLDLGNRAAIDQSLSRLVRRGTIRRLARGVYDFPKRHPKLGDLSPTTDDVARAIAGRDAKLQVSRARAANALGLSTQVPAKAIWLTDGRSRDVRLGNQMIRLKHVAPSSLIGAGSLTGLVLQALKYVGRDGVDDHLIRTLRSKLSDDAKAGVLRDVKQQAQVADWMRPVVSQIAAGV